MSAAAPIEVARDSTLVDEGNRLQALFYAVQECMRSAISSIRSHRMRSFLTMLGVIIGVASVICIVSLLQGLTQSVMNEFQGIGGNTLSIHSHTSNEDRLIGKWNKMRPADLELVRYRVAGISNVTPMMGINLPGGVRNGSNSAGAQVIASTSWYQLANPEGAFCRRRRDFGRRSRRSLFSLGEDDVNQHRVAVSERPPLRARGHVAQADALADHQFGHVHVDVLGNVARQALDLDFAADELEDAALHLDALGLALDEDRNRDLDHAVHGHAVEVRVQHLVGDGIELEVLHQHLRIHAIELERDERVRARLGVQDFQQRLRFDRDGHRVAAGARTGRPVYGGGHLALAPGAARFVLADGRADRCVEQCFHVSFLSTFRCSRQRCIRAAS